MLRGVKALQTRKISAYGFENLHLQGFASHSENFEGKLCRYCCRYIISSSYGRIKLIISLNLLGDFEASLNNFKSKFVAFLSLLVWHSFFLSMFRR